MKTGKHHIKERTITVKLGQLKEDFSVYPRMDVDTGHTSQITEAMRVGVVMPLIIVEDKTLRIVDGMHRERSLFKIHGEKKGKELDIKVIARTYVSDNELLLDASSLNVSHGRSLTAYDKKHAILLAEKLGIAAVLIASALNMTVERVTECRAQCATVEQTRVVTPLKTPIRHMEGREITQEQAAIIPKLGGNQQMFYVDQLIMLIDTEMINRENAAMLAKLEILSSKITSFLSKAHLVAPKPVMAMHSTA